MIFSNFIKSLSEAFTASGYSRTASELQSFSDTQLADLGLSRELLKQGASAYPWRVEAVEAEIAPDNVTSLEVSPVELESDSSSTQKAA